MTRVACGAVVAAMALSTASAADIRPYTVPAPISAYSWTGPYLGGQLGYQWGSTTHNPTRPSGIAGGVQAGYLWQNGQFVVGAEADIGAAAARDRFAPWKFATPWLGTLRARAGFLLSGVLAYGTIGMAFGGGEAEFAGASESHTHLGWAAGGGLEIPVTSNLTARLEYLFVDLAGRRYVATGVSNGFESSLVRLGVNYRF